MTGTQNTRVMDSHMLNLEAKTLELMTKELQHCIDQGDQEAVAFCLTKIAAHVNFCRVWMKSITNHPDLLDNLTVAQLETGEHSYTS